MPESAARILNSPVVREALHQAWQDSKPGPTGGHEEGGFILQDSAQQIRIRRWPPGEKDSIVVPSHADCRFEGDDIIATFHTHPNTGDDYLQEPGETDKRAIRDDPNLKGRAYQGEFVISAQTIYLVSPHGHIDEVAPTQEYFAKG